MATVNNNFRIKNGLVVEGTTATVNGLNILTTSTFGALNTFTTTQTITPATSVTGLIINAAASSIGLIVKANVTTPGNIQEWQNSAGAIQSAIGSDGTFQIKNIRNVGGSVNRAVFSDLSSSVVINAANTNYVGLSVRRFSDAQTLDLQQWTNSSASTVYAKIDKDGNATAASFIRTGGTSSQFLMADGSVTTGSSQEIIPLDDIRGEFNGINSIFVPKYQGIKQSITNPLRLQLTINGIIQYVDFPDYVWQSPLPREGFQINNDGNIAFSEVVPAGSSFDARIMPGPDVVTKIRQYPFKAVDILLGG